MMGRVKGARQYTLTADMAKLLEQVATSAGLTIGEWIRALVRRELARLAAEKPKGRK